MNASRARHSLAAALLIGFAAALSGCVAASPRVRTCAIILMVDGRQQVPSKSQFDAVQRKMATQFEQQSIRLVPDLSSAELIATIECRTGSGDASWTDLIVRDVSRNTFTPIFSKVTHPTLERSDREHLESLRGINPTRID